MHTFPPLNQTQTFPIIHIFFYIYSPQSAQNMLTIFYVCVLEYTAIIPSSNYSKAPLFHSLPPKSTLQWFTGQ